MLTRFFIVSIAILCHTPPVLLQTRFPPDRFPTEVPVTPSVSTQSQNVSNVLTEPSNTSTNSATRIPTERFLTELPVTQSVSTQSQNVSDVRTEPSNTGSISYTLVAELPVTQSVSTQSQNISDALTEPSNTVSISVTRIPTDVPLRQPIMVSSCPDGWHEVQPQLSKRQAYESYRCIKFFSKPDTFEKAQEQCGREGSFLVAVGYSYSAALPEDLHDNLGNLSGQSFWTGLHLINNSFYWDDVVPKRHNEYSTLCPGCTVHWPSNFTVDQYSTMLSTCRKLGDMQRQVLDRSYSHSSDSDVGQGCDGGPLQDGCFSARLVPDRSQLLLASESCETRLPYFCFRKVDTSYYFVEDPDCGKPWVYNSYNGLSYAYFGNSLSKSYDEAQAACEAVNSTVSSASTSDSLKVLTSLLRGNVVEAYVDSTKSSTNSCNVLRFDAGNVSIGIVDCSLKLPFSCQKACGNTALAQLQYKSDSSTLECSVSSKMSGSIFWSRNDAYWARQFENPASAIPSGSLAWYRCGVFQNRRPTRRIWSNAVLANSRDDPSVSYRVLVTLNETFNPLLLKLVYLLQSDDNPLSPAEHWITNFRSFVLEVFTPQVYKSATVIGISPLTADKTIVYFEFTLYYGEQTQRASMNLRQTFWEYADRNNKVSGPSQAVDLIVRDPFYCPDTFLSVSPTRVVHPTATLIGGVIQLGTCGSEGLISCSGDFATGAFWDTSTWYLNESSRDQSCIAGLLKNLSQVEHDERKIVTILKVLVNLTHSAYGLDQRAITAISELVTTIVATMRSAVNQEHLLEAPHLIGTVVSNLMNAELSKAFEEQSKTNTSFQRSMEEAVLWLMKAASSSSDNSSIVNATLLSFSSPNLAFKIDINSSNTGVIVAGSPKMSPLSPLVLINDTKVMTNDSDSTSLVFDHRYAKVPKAFIVYGSSMLFRASASKWRAQHRVISAQLLHPVENQSSSGIAITTFRDFYEERDLQLLACGFWDFNTSSWSLSGCTKNLTVDGKLICSCNHLTNYAVLLDTTPSTTNPDVEQALTIVSYIGLGLSIAGLSAVIVSFLAIRDMRKTNQQKVVFSLSLSLLSLNIVFLVGVDRTDNREGCIAVAALLHYFLLTSFAWMATEAIGQYLRFVKVLGAYIPRFLIKASIPAWGIPAVVVAALCSIRSDLYYNTSYCLPQPVVVQFAIAVPAGLVLVVNTVIFSMVMRNLCCRQKSIHLHSNQSEQRKILLHGQAGLAMSVVLGLTWLFGYLQIPQISTLRLIAQWMFCICNSTQGLLIFLFFFALKQSFWQSWRKGCCKRSLTKRSYEMSLDDLLRTNNGTKSTSES